MARGSNKGFTCFYSFLGSSFRDSGSDRVFSPYGRNEKKWVIALSGWVCLLFGLILLFRSGLGAVGNASAIDFLRLLLVSFGHS